MLRAAPRDWAAGLAAGLLGWIAAPALAALLPAAPRGLPLALLASRALAWAASAAATRLLAGAPTRRRATGSASQAKGLDAGPRRPQSSSGGRP